MRKIKAGKLNMKPEFKVSDEFLTLKDMDTNVIVERLEGEIQMREMSVEKKLKKGFLKL